MTRDIHRAIVTAMQRCPEPVVRIWLTRDDLGVIQSMQDPAIPVSRYMGVPVSVAEQPMHSRVVSETGRSVPI